MESYTSKTRVGIGMLVPRFMEGDQGPQIMSAEDMNVHADILQALVRCKIVGSTKYAVTLQDGTFLIEVRDPFLNPVGTPPGGGGVFWATITGTTTADSGHVLLTCNTVSVAGLKVALPTYLRTVPGDCTAAAIHPAYGAGQVIYIAAPEGGTDEAVSGVPVKYVDLNADARTWKIQTMVCVDDGMGGFVVKCAKVCMTAPYDCP